MKKLLLAALIGIAGVLCSGTSCLAQNDEQFEIPRYPIDLEGVIQDVTGNPLDNATLHIRTEYPTVPFTEEAERRYHRLNVNSSFHVQLSPGTLSMTVVAEKAGYARSSEYSFEEEQLAAKDVVIRLIPAVRQSDLDTGLAWPKITEEGKSFGFSFRKWRKISLDGVPVPTDMCIYLEVIGEPESYEDTDSYSVALVGAGVEFCEAFLLPPLKYIQNQQRFADELLQAPEEGYMSRIEADDLADLSGRYFYFKTQEAKYGKLWIQTVEASDRLLAGIKCYYQPDGTRDLAAEVILAPQYVTTPITPFEIKKLKIDWKKEGKKPKMDRIEIDGRFCLPAGYSASDLEPDVTVMVEIGGSSGTDEVMAKAKKYRWDYKRVKQEIPAGANMDIRKLQIKWDKKDKKPDKFKLDGELDVVNDGSGVVAVTLLIPAITGEDLKGTQSVTCRVKKHYWHYHWDSFPGSE